VKHEILRRRTYLEIRDVDVKTEYADIMVKSCPDDKWVHAMWETRKKGLIGRLENAVLFGNHTSSNIIWDGDDLTTLDLLV